VPPDATFPLGALRIQVTDPANRATGAANARLTATTTTFVIQFQQAAEMIRAYFGIDWEAFLWDGTTGAFLSGNGTTITITIEDGGRGDADGIANGVVVTTVAPARPTGGTTANCYGARSFGGGLVALDTKIVGPPGRRNNLAVYVGSSGGQCAGTPRPASQEYSFYVTASTEAQALGVAPDFRGACNLVAPTGQAQPFSLLYFNGPANRYICLGTPPLP